MTGESTEEPGTVSKVARAATTETTGFISNLFGSIFKVPLGAFKGIFSNTIGNLFGTLLTGGIVAGVARFVPNFIEHLPGGEQIVDISKKEGDAGLLKASALAALVINGGIGAIKGGAGAVAESTDAASTGGKIGAFVGTTAIITTMGALAFQVMNKHEIGFGGTADHAGTKTPPTTPVKTDNTKAIG